MNIQITETEAAIVIGILLALTLSTCYLMFWLGKLEEKIKSIQSKFKEIIKQLS